MKRELEREFVKTIHSETGDTHIYRLVMTEEERQRNREAAGRAGMKLIESVRKRGEMA